MAASAGSTKKLTVAVRTVRSEHQTGKFSSIDEQRTFQTAHFERTVRTPNCPTDRLVPAATDRFLMDPKHLTFLCHTFYSPVNRRILRTVKCEPQNLSL